MTILVVLGVVLQAGFALKDTWTEPEYNQFPTTYDFDYDHTIELDLSTNMVAYKLFIFNEVTTTNEAYSYLRVVFMDQLKKVPAVFCKDYFAAEIEAEASVPTNSSTFFTDNFANQEWLCPNLTQTNVTDQKILDLSI